MSNQKRKKNQVSMDQINSWLVTLHQLIEDEVDLSIEDQEHLEALMYGNISEHLEKLFDYPGYSNYN